MLSAEIGRSELNLPRNTITINFIKVMKPNTKFITFNTEPLLKVKVEKCKA
jgi:hypothetical protein